MEHACPLCLAIRNASGYQAPLAVENTPLRESERFVVMPCVGPLVAGQAIVVSRGHFLSLASMGDEAVLEYDGFVRHLLGKEIGWLEVEHGSTAEDCAGACVTHAHVHLIPNADRFAEALDGVLPELYCGDQLKFPGAGVPYVFLRGALGVTRVFQGSGLPSQVMRRIICAAIGREDWDWREMPRDHLLLETLEFWRNRG